MEEKVDKEKEAKWIIDDMVSALRAQLKGYPRRVVEMPFLEDELRERKVRLIIKNENANLFTLVFVENNVVRVEVKTEEEFLHLLMDIIATKLGATM